ncbi:MAG: cell wall-binding repeat-containing protein [Egibacteraceae bacterium]
MTERTAGGARGSYQPKRPRALAGLVVLTLAGALVAGAVPTGTAAPSSAAAAITSQQSAVERIAGSDRYATAALLARRAATGGAERVWLVTGLDFPDALAASASGDPVLLVTPDQVPDATAAALADIAPDQVVAAGGTSVISDSVLAAAGDLAQAGTSRTSGTDRYATAAAVADRTHPDGARTVWLATGLDFPDALAAGAVAGVEDAPLLLAAGDRLTPAVRAALARLSPSEIVVVGGEQAVSAAAEQEAADTSDGAQVTRLGGPGRFHTAALIVERARDAHGRSNPVFLATGEDYPDALAAGPAAVAAGGPLLLAQRDALPEPTRQMLLSLSPATVHVVGGPNALSDYVADYAARPHEEPRPTGGACDRYDATAPGVIQGHPEDQRPSLDAWSGPWMIDHFRDTWELAVPYRWRFDLVNTVGHGGVLFYEDSEAEGGNPYAHRHALTVFCGNPFLVGGGQALDPRDPAQIRAHGPHGPRGQPTIEQLDTGTALYSAQWRNLGHANPTDDYVVQYDYVAVDADVIMLVYEAHNRFARDIDGRTGDINDAITGSISRAGQAPCPPNADHCRRDRDRTQGGTPP